MCVEKREEGHEKRDTHVCGRVHVRTGGELRSISRTRRSMVVDIYVRIKPYTGGFIVRATNGLNAQATRGAVSSKCPVSCGSAKTK